MKEQEYCHICGRKIKRGECKTCRPDPDEKFVADCRGVRYANALVISAYVDLVLTDRRLLAFEDVKGSMAAGVQAGVAGQGGLVGGLIGALGKSIAGDPKDRVVAKGRNGSLKFETPLSAITGIETEEKKNAVHTFINTTSGKPLRVVLGTSYDGTLGGDEFRNMLIAALQ